MKELTFAFDCQLTDNEDYISAGTKVKVSENEFYLNRFPGATPVIVMEAKNYKGEPIEIFPTVEWFDNSSFIELN